MNATRVTLVAAAILLFGTVLGWRRAERRADEAEAKVKIEQTLRLMSQTAHDELWRQKADAVPAGHRDALNAHPGIGMAR